MVGIGNYSMNNCSRIVVRFGSYPVISDTRKFTAVNTTWHIFKVLQVSLMDYVMSAVK